MTRAEWISIGAGLALFAASAAADPWTDAGWAIKAEESKVESWRGRESLLLRNGTAWLDTAGFRDGVIEFDLAASDSQGFHGLVFRAVDRENFENVYLRPHQSGNPDATQYQAVYNGTTAWQLHTGERFSLPVEIDLDRWIHVRAAISGRRLELSIDGQTLVFPGLLREPVAGAIGLTSSGAPGRFANIVVRPGTPANQEGGAGAVLPEIPAGTVGRWRVSTAFPESRVDRVTPLEAADSADLTWGELDAGPHGIANLAILRRRDEQQNTVFAAVTLRSSEARPVRFRFGFSDRVVVFLNGRPIYRGDDEYRSRDYRFLGSVGLYDEVILPLRAGPNELWLAVSEDFGGWGVIARIEEPGVEVVIP